jgi:hypothetical protein
MTKKYFIYILFLIILVSGFTFAQNSLAWSFSDISGLTKTTAGEAGLSQTDYAVIVANIITAILGIVGVIFVILFIYGGFIWLTSAGNEEKIGKAKKILSYAVIGVIIVAGAYAITTFIAGAIPAGTGVAPTGGTTPTGATDCTGGTPPGVCATYDYCLRTLQGTNLGVKDQCPNQICCKPSVSPQKCSECGKKDICHLRICSTIFDICTKTECEMLGCNCHFRIPNFCDYDPNYNSCNK